MNLRKISIIISIVLLIVIGYGLTYIPHKVINIEPEDISRICFYDATTAEYVEIRDDMKIERIMTNLNNVKFKKEKLSIGYLGFRFMTTIYNSEGKVIKKLYINSNDYIRYKGFFYTVKESTIDYDYIEKLFP